MFGSSLTYNPYKCELKMVAIHSDFAFSKLYIFKLFTSVKMYTGRDSSMIASMDWPKTTIYTKNVPNSQVITFWKSYLYFSGSNFSNLIKSFFTSSSFAKASSLFWFLAALLRAIKSNVNEFETSMPWPFLSPVFGHFMWCMQ